MERSQATPHPPDATLDKTLYGNLVDIHNEEVYPARLELSAGRIARITRQEGPLERFILPGFIDAHVHIESSMLPPSEFARLALPHGTVATLSDPHEIANVLGLAGVRYMLDDAAKTPLKIHFGAPPCVPATGFETAGAALSAVDVSALLDDPRVHYLSEVMNVPGVLSGDEALMQKLMAARARGKRIDGHAPELRGEALRRYLAAGISSDHESVSYEEAEEKLRAGLTLMIREGSAAKGLELLLPLLNEFPGQVMFCTDDLHPDDLALGHIGALVKRGLKLGYPLMPLLRAACVTPALHYGLDVGLLREGDAADFIVVGSLDELDVLETYIESRLVARDGTALLPHQSALAINCFAATTKQPGDFRVPAAPGKLRVIVAEGGKLTTGEVFVDPLEEGGAALADPERDVLKLSVVNRYSDAPPAVAFVRGFGLKEGALASSVAHDSHNIVAVGASDEALCEAVNLVIAQQGGLALVGRGLRECLPLPIAGLMSDADGPQVAAHYAALSALAKGLGSSLTAPYMTLSFMALLVIPKLKLSDRGLFSGERFEFCELFVPPNHPAE